MKKHYNTILSLLPTCKTMAELKQLHALMITSSVIRNIIPVSKLVDLCVDPKTGNLRYARSVFDRIAWPSLYIWNSMIRGYSNSDTPAEALIMYGEMRQSGFSPDHFTYPFALKACSAIVDRDCGRSVHNCVVKAGFEVGVHSSTALLHMYACCGDMEAGLKVFEAIPKWNVVAWASLISGLVSNNRASEAIRVFKDMESSDVEPNEIMMVNVLVACARTGDLEAGKWVHDRINGLGYDPFLSGRDYNIILATAIVDMYAKCGSLETARELFEKMPQRNSVSWNSMIYAYNKHGRAEESLDLFVDMQISGFLPDQATFVAVIGACASLGALALGQCLHACIAKNGMSKDLSIGTSLVHMYAKTGDLVSARRVFDTLQRKDVEAWTTMIVGLAINGHGAEALTTFESMQDDATTAPDQITYIGVLSACSHVGLVNEGLRHFNEMRNAYGIVPEQEHYCCVVDLLSRAGRFEKATRLIEEMPFKPNITIWGALLNGCEIHENVDLANRIRSHIANLKPESSGVYVLLSNIYAKAGNWQEANLARELMKQRRVSKTLGYSQVQKLSM